MKSIIKFYLITFLVGGLGCVTIESKEDKIVDIQQFPVVLDTLDTEIDSCNLTSYVMGDYPPLYFGKREDTILINHWFNCFGSARYDDQMGGTVRPKYCIEWDQPRFHKSWNKSTISINIDTTQRIKSRVMYSEGYVEAYPVVLENNEKDTIQIGYGSHLPIVAEARDLSNKWRSIEEMWMYSCGTGIGTMNLPPQEIALTAVSICSGDFLTMVRLRIGENYSNEFHRRINRSQFKEEIKRNRSKVVLGPF